MPATNKTKPQKMTVSTTNAAPVSKATSATDLGSVVNDITSFLDTAEPKLGPEPTVTTATQKRHVSKPRKGADKVLPVIAAIVKQHGLDSSSLSSDTVMDAYTMAQTLLPLQTRLQKMSKRVSDAAFAAQTDAWSMGLQLYAMLKRRAKTDGQVAQNIAPLAHVFSYRNPVVKAGKPTKRETQVKAQVKHVTALAEKHGVAMPGSAAGSVGAGAGAGVTQVQAAPVQAMPAAQVQAAPVAQVQAAPVAQVQAAPVAQAQTGGTNVGAVTVATTTGGGAVAPSGTGSVVAAAAPVAAPSGPAAAGSVVGH